MSDLGFFILSIFYLQIYFMSQVKLPEIQNRRLATQGESNEFSYRSRRKSQGGGQVSHQFVDQIQKKLNEQKRQIEFRNQTIYGLQRNISSLSQIVTATKEQSFRLKKQLERMRKNDGQENQELRSKCILLQNQIDVLKLELKSVKRAHQDCSKINSQRQSYRNQAKELEKQYQHMLKTIRQLEDENKILSKQILRLKGEHSDKIKLNQRIIQMQQEISKLKKDNLSFLERNRSHQKSKSERISIEHKASDLLKQNKDLQTKRKSLQNQKELLHKENQTLKAIIDELETKNQGKQQYEKIKVQQNNKFKQQIKKCLIKVQQQKEQIGQLKAKNDELMKKNDELMKKNEKYVTVINQKIQMLEKEKQKCFSLQNMLINKEKGVEDFMGNLSDKVDELIKKQIFKRLNKMQDAEFLAERNSPQRGNSRNNSNLEETKILDKLDIVANKINFLSIKYGQNMDDIDHNQRKKVVITNEEELNKINARKDELQKKIETITNQKNQKIDQLKAIIEQLKSKIEQINEEKNNFKEELRECKKMEQKHEKKIKYLEQQLAEKQNQRNKFNQMMEKEAEKHQQEMKEIKKLFMEGQSKNIQDNIQWQQKLTREKKQVARIKKMLDECKRQEQKLKEKIIQLNVSKESEKDEKQRKISKQMRSLNEKKEVEKEQLVRKINQQWQEKLRQKDIELQRQRKNNKYLWQDNRKLKSKEVQVAQQAEKVILNCEKTKKKQIQKVKRNAQQKIQLDIRSRRDLEKSLLEMKRMLNDKNQQIRQISQKNKHTKKQVEFYKSRIRELEGIVERKQASHQEEIEQLERQIFRSKQAISGIDQKSREIEQAKDWSEKKIRKQNLQLKRQLEELRKKNRNQKNQEKKIKMEQKLENMEQVLQAMVNCLNCNFCVELVKDCVRLQDCGHIYCKKCVDGYTPMCTECHSTSQAVKDLTIQETVIQTESMKQLLKEVKEQVNTLIF